MTAMRQIVPVKPAAYAFDVFVLNDDGTSKLVGGVKYNPGAYLDSEPAWRDTCDEWARHLPGKRIHVEEIDPAEHDEKLGKPWPGEGGV